MQANHRYLITDRYNRNKPVEVETIEVSLDNNWVKLRYNSGNDEWKDASSITIVSELQKLPSASELKWEQLRQWAEKNNATTVIYEMERLDG
jgi:hypothetical protein